MIYRRKGARSSAPSGFYSFESLRSKSRIYGFSEGDYIRLRDEFGTVWCGIAEHQNDNSILFRFRDDKGNSISGISDSLGIILRDNHGKTWRGFID